MIIPVPADIVPAERLGRVHFVGIGGAALSGLARIMHQRGIEVTGSDKQDSDALRSLRALGIVCHLSHDRSHVEAADTVVVSTAIPEGNVEVVRARELGLRVWPRSAAVQSVMLGRSAVVITGTHGKTTTTSMLTTALIACGADPSYAIGSTLTTSGVGAASGSGDLFVAEGDESDGAILTYTPLGAVVTNVDADHLDHFGTREAYAAVFEAFAARILPGGFLVCCTDDRGAARLADRVEAGRSDIAVIRVGVERGNDLVGADVALTGRMSRYLARTPDRELGRVELAVPGRGYVLDSICALAAGLRLGFEFGQLAAGLAAFRGSARRMEFKGEAGGVLVYDSYAHHPAEIASDIAAGRQLSGSGRLIVAFQPHLFSRTAILATDMGHALSAADVVVVTDVYPARERPVAGVDGSLVHAAVIPPAEAIYEPDKASLPALLARLAASGDTVLTLGAGDITEVGRRVVARIEAASPQSLHRDDEARGPDDDQDRDRRDRDEQDGVVQHDL